MDRIERLPEIGSSSVRKVAFQPPAEELPERRPGPLPIQPPRTAPVSSTTKPPTLEELEQMALANNPTLVEAQARIDAARGRGLQVGLKPNPVVGYSGQQLGSGGQAEQQGVFLGQEFIRGGKRRLNRAVVQQEIGRAEQELATQQFRVLTDCQPVWNRPETRKAATKGCLRKRGTTPNWSTITKPARSASTRFDATDRGLCHVLDDLESVSGKLRVTIGGKPFVGQITDNHDSGCNHGHQH